ncbi:MAG: alpha/beta hydrolase [Caulobacterales bacterium]
MPLDRRAKRLLDILAATRRPDAPRESAEDRRHSLRTLAHMVDEAPDPAVQVEDLQISGPAGEIGLRIYAPPCDADGPLPGLVFFHGGGWVAGGLDTHDGLCRRLCQQARCRVIAVDYRLAPEHPFPAAIDDCFAATRWVADHARQLGVDAARLAVGGDSAGGGLAAAVCQLARDHGGPRIALQLLICPILDMAGGSDSRRDFAESFFLSQATIRRDLEDYLPPGADLADPRLSPLRAPDAGRLPPAIVHTAEFDPFRDEGRAYALRLRRAGVRVRDVCHPGMIHYFYAMARAIPYAATAAQMIGADFRDLIAGGVRDEPPLPE